MGREPTSSSHRTATLLTITGSILLVASFNEQFASASFSLPFMQKLGAEISFLLGF